MFSQACVCFVAATSYADELKMLAWDNEDAQLQCDHK